MLARAFTRFVFIIYYSRPCIKYKSYRLYETQVKKVIKVQSMLRAFITKRKMAPQLLKQQSGNIDDVLIES